MISTQKTDVKECPLCMENLELDDLHFFPCKCKYQVCRFCWNRIITSENGLCPACRRPYNSEEPASFQPMTNDEIKQLKKRHKTKLSQMDDIKKELMDKRVVQPNLLFVANIPPSLPLDEEALRSDEYFGKYGPVVKVVLTHTTTTANSTSTTNAVINSSTATNNNTTVTFTSAYVTYRDKRNAFLALLELNRVGLHGHRTMKVSLGTTKYCSQYLKGLPCSKKECMYLHQRADVRASFTKEEMTAGKHTQYEQELLEDFLRELSPNTYPEGHFQTLKAPPKPLFDGSERKDATALQSSLPTSTTAQTNHVRTNLSSRSSNQQQSKSLRESNASHNGTGVKKHPNSKSVSSVTPHHLSQKDQCQSYTGACVASASHQLGSLPVSSSSASSRSRQNSEPSPIVPFVASGENSVICTTVIDNSCDRATLAPIGNARCHDVTANRNSGDTSPPHYQVNNNSTYIFSSSNGEGDSGLGKSRSHCNYTDEDHSWLLDIVTENLSNLHQMAREEQQNQNVGVVAFHREQSALPHSIFPTSTSLTNFTQLVSTPMSSTSQDIPSVSAPPCGPPPGFEDIDNYRHSVPPPCFSNCAPLASETFSASFTATHSDLFSRCPMTMHPSYSSDTLSSYSTAQKHLPHHTPHLQQQQQQQRHFQLLSSDSSSVVGLNGPMPTSVSTSLTTSSSKWLNGCSSGNDSSFHPGTAQMDPKQTQDLPFDVFAMKPSGSLPSNQKDLSEMLKTILPVDATLRFGSDVSHIPSVVSGSQPTRSISNPHSYSSRTHQNSCDSPWSMDDPAIIMSMSYQSSQASNHLGNVIKSSEEFYSSNYSAPSSQHHQQRLSWNRGFSLNEMESPSGIGDSIWSSAPLVHNITTMNHMVQQCHHPIGHGCYPGNHSSQLQQTTPSAYSRLNSSNANY